MFNAIAHRYDLLNGGLSGGLDRYWRHRLISKISTQNGFTIADVGTGTGDVLLGLCRQRYGSSFLNLVGIDPAEKMLERAKAKTPNGVNIAWQVGSATELPFLEATVDYVTMAFVLRNIATPKAALTEIYRVLKPGASLLILEFSIPTGWFKWPYLFYFRRVLPLLGNWISGHRDAYTYLNQSVEQFSPPEVVLDRLKVAGFSSVTVESLTWGTVTLYHAIK